MFLLPECDPPPLHHFELPLTFPVMFAHVHCLVRVQRDASPFARTPSWPLDRPSTVPLAPWKVPHRPHNPVSSGRACVNAVIFPYPAQATLSGCVLPDELC